MNLPPFDSNGNLTLGPPPGLKNHLIDVPLADLQRKFVTAATGSSTRARIWQGWMEHRLEFEALGLPYITLVDGSFTSTRKDPGDVDFCVLVDAAALNALDAATYYRYELLTNTRHTKPLYACDVYGVAVYSLTDGRFKKTLTYVNYFSRLFGMDKRGNPKCTVLVTERGTL